MQEQVRQARARIAEVLAAISSARTPEDISSCVPLVGDATAALGSAPDLVPDWQAHPDLIRDFEKLQSQLQLAEKMIAGGTEFYRGWARILMPDAESYTPSGAAPAVAPPGSVSVVG